MAILKKLRLLPLSVLPFVLCATPTTPVGVRLSLVSEVTAIQPGNPFAVALEVVHEPGFHTYWRNPGIVGVPFMIDWNLPEGFSHGAIQWPAPRRVMMFDYPANGYKDDVLLITHITPPAEFSPTQEPIRVAAHVRLMACSRTCHPGYYPVSIELPLATSSTSSPSWHPTWKNAFDQTRAAFPKPLSGWTALLRTAKDAPLISFDLVPLNLVPQNNHTHDPGNVLFFSDDGQISTLPEPTISRSKDGTIHLTAPRAEFSPKGSERLSGVLWAERGWHPDGSPVYATIDIPYAPPPGNNE